LTRNRSNIEDWLTRMNERKSMTTTTWDAVARLAMAS